VRLPAPSSAQPDETPTRIEAMRAKIKAGGHDSPYRLRKQLLEPVFGQIKQARGFRQFLLRSFEKVRAEWALVCTAHNLLKLANSRILSVAPKSALPAGRTGENGRGKHVTPQQTPPQASATSTRYDNPDRLLGAGRIEHQFDRQPETKMPHRCNT
jgi:hypothetical protein